MAGKPTVPLVEVHDGNFYGTTASGGADGKGTIFEMTPEGVDDVSTNSGVMDPRSPLVVGPDGDLYGTQTAFEAACNISFGVSRSSHSLSFITTTALGGSD